MIKFLKIILSKNYRKTYYKKVLNDYNRYGIELEKIYSATNVI